jgi:hypothetical protein
MKVFSAPARGCAAEEVKRQLRISNYELRIEKSFHS